MRRRQQYGLKRAKPPFWEFHRAPEDERIDEMTGILSQLLGVNSSIGIIECITEGRAALVAALPRQKIV